jgi:two-component system nitrogen regulation response regulator NtrX
MRSKTALDVLVVDDDPAIRRTLRGVLEDEGHSVADATDGRQALDLLLQRPFDVVLLDVKMPGMGGLEALDLIREQAASTGVIMVSGEGTIPTAVRALKHGAFDFIEKPVDPEHLLQVLAQAAQLTALRRHGPVRAADELGIIGRSPAIQRLIADIHRAAPAEAKVLITGENGAGKDLVAEAIHRLSKRSAKPFVKLNCAAIPKDLVESELFGYERGAFTGATQRKPGRLERAHEGTLFLDEIGDLSPEAQAKLLRAIETGDVDRVGATETFKVDVRIVSATNKDLSAAIERGEFRRDLFYRLNTLPIHVAPLRERPSDVAVLAETFLEQFCRAEGRPAKRLTPEAIELLQEYRWPGNVRELKNLMERCAILVDGEQVGAGDLAPWLQSDPEAEEATGLRADVERHEAEAIRRALEAANWNVTQAAAGLGIDRTNLHRKMRKYGLARR